MQNSVKWMQANKVFDLPMKLNKKFKRFLFAIAIATVCFLILNWCFPLKLNVKYSQIITDDKGKVIHAFLSDDDKWRMMTELNEISPCFANL